MIAPRHAIVFSGLRTNSGIHPEAIYPDYALKSAEFHEMILKIPSTEKFELQKHPRFLVLLHCGKPNLTRINVFVSFNPSPDALDSIVYRLCPHQIPWLITLPEIFLKKSLLMTAY